MPLHPAGPYVGASAFAHKARPAHLSAIGRAGGAAYEHVDPDVGRQRHPRSWCPSSAGGPACR